MAWHGLGVVAAGTREMGKPSEPVRRTGGETSRPLTTREYRAVVRSGLPIDGERTHTLHDSGNAARVVAALARSAVD